MDGNKGVDGGVGVAGPPSSERPSEHRWIREHARRIEQQLATAQQITHIGSWEWNIDTGAVVWSDELYRIYGLEPQSCEITFESFLGRLHPDDRDRVRSAVQNAIESKKPFGYPERIVRPDGSVRDLDTLGEPSFGARGEFVGLIGTCRDVTDDRARERLEAGVHRTLEMIASGAPLAETLTTLLGVIEAESDGMLGSILVLDPLKGILRTGAAPRLPEAYNRKVEGFVPGPRAGSCGTAVFLRKPVFVTDTLEDPLWSDYRFVATEFGLRSCWSTPIFAKDGRVTGTFALYYREPRSPNERQLELIQRATHIAGIAVERKQMEEQLQALTARVERVREEERTGIAREIHDELGQSLTGLKMDVAWVGRRLAGAERVSVDELRQRMTGMSDLIDETINQVRRISAELRPGVLDHLGLLAAIEWQAQEHQKRTGTRCTVSSNLGDQKFGRDLSTGVFRIFQEALTNVARHAEAKQVTVKLERDGDRLELDVQDDGKGISDDAARSPSSLGLLGLRERARRLGGEVSVEAVKPRGTRVRLRVPVVENDGETA
jgi:signal transduction histidine kinase